VRSLRELRRAAEGRSAEPTSRELIRVGFWAPVAPDAAADDHWVVSLFGAILSTIDGTPPVGGYINPDWDPKERDIVLAYVNDRSHCGKRYMGYSKCRVCGCHNGTADFHDNAYVWPEGFGHYIEAHAVKPPQHFIDHVLATVR
jgi:hypothetical protein